VNRQVISRTSRLIDVASVGLIIVGATMFGRAYLGMERVRNSPDVPFARGTMEAYALTNQFLRFQRLSYVGIGLVGVGIAVGLSAAAHARTIRRRQDAPRPRTE
jgi:hypothetical protein